MILTSPRKSAQGVSSQPARPINLRDSEVRALLDTGRAEIRRDVKWSRRYPIEFIGGSGQKADPECWGYAVEDEWMVLARGLRSRGLAHGSTSIPCPYGELGEQLWGRETWAQPGTVARSDDPIRVDRRIVYKATEVSQFHSWRSPMHMPRWASRLALDVVRSDVERVGDWWQWVVEAVRVEVSS